jgi:competence protein ComEC
VGQGDGLIITQGFSQMVIDTGRDDGAMADCLGQVLPFWDRQLEMVMISHQDDDHAGGLREVTETYEVKRLITAEKAKPAIEEMVVDAIEVEIGFAGERWRWGETLIEIVWPPPLSELPYDLASSTNDSGLVLRLQFGVGESIWLAGDAGEVVEQNLLNRGGVKPTTALKVAHHGSSTASTKPFLEMLQSHLFLISVGENNYGHPSRDVLERLTESGGVVRRTDVEGLIRWVPK